MYWNEVIFFAEPCKLYMDCELECESPPDREEYVIQIHQAVCRTVNKPDLAPPLVLDGSRPGKFSLHLVWPGLWCKSPDPAARIANAVQRERIMGVSVDMMVYPKDNKTPKTLRMPYCGKLRDPGAGIMLPVAATSAAFDQDLFCSHLITFHSGRAPTYSRILWLQEAVKDAFICDNRFMSGKFDQEVQSRPFHCEKNKGSTMLYFKFELSAIHTQESFHKLHVWCVFYTL